MKKIALLILLLAAADACAQYRRMKPLAESMKKIFDVRLDRFIETCDLINVWKISRLDEWRGGVGAYKSNLKVLGLNRGMIKPLGTFDFELFTFPEMITKFTYEDMAGKGTRDNVMTIYHELAHAEFDVVIEEKRANSVDKDFLKVSKEVTAWCATNEKESNAENCMLEWHGYFVEGVVSATISDWHNLLNSNGIKDDLTIDEAIVRRNVGSGKVTPDKYGKLLPDFLMAHIRTDLDTEYGKRSRNHMMVVGRYGGLSQTFVSTGGWAAKGFKEEWWDMVWKHFRDHHGWPLSMKVLIERLGKSYAADVLPKLKAAQEAAAAGGRQ